jgi:hypothetical protein
VICPEIAEALALRRAISFAINKDHGFLLEKCCESKLCIDVPKLGNRYV